MAMTRTETGITFECDDCSEFYESDERDLLEAVGVLRNEGWSVRKEHGAWAHRCPTCEGDHF